MPQLRAPMPDLRAPASLLQDTHVLDKGGRGVVSPLDRAGLSAELVCADALGWHPETPFDAIYEQTCLCALDPTHWPDYERQLHAWLKPGGRLCALFMQTGRAGGPPHHCALPDMRALFREDMWTWTEQPHKQVPHPDGIFEYTAVLARR